MYNLLERGAFVLSIDAESFVPLTRDPMCQEVIGLLLELMERYNIHATWAVQGNMLVDRREFVVENQSPGVIPNYEKLSLTESLVNKPYTQLHGAPSWKGKNVIQQILSCKTSQEIGCHTFSHTRAGDLTCNREKFEAELKTCQQVFDRFGVTLYSFIYPWNSVQYVDSLRNYGYIAYRGPSPDWYARLPAFLQRLAYPVDHWLRIPSPVPTVSCEMGVWNLPASYFYFCGAGWGKMIPMSLRVNKVKKGLHLAARERQLFHLWFHPFNLVSNTKYWLRGLESIFAEVSRCRDRGVLENLTMGEVAIKLENSTKGKNTVSHSIISSSKGKLKYDESSPLKRGVFTLSLDTELAWGAVHGGNLKEREVLLQQTRECIGRLLKLLEKYQIHATWAVVGHLFLEQCQPVNGIKHPEIIRPKYSWFPDDWFLPDPCSRLEDAPLWYGRDIIRQILNCQVSQEIGCHTFSHVQVGEPGCSRECFASELRACRVEAEKLGLNLHSFVFPRNLVGQLDILAEAGFTAYRGVTSHWSERFPVIVSRACRQLDHILPLSPPVVLPKREDGLWNMSASYFYPSTYRWWGRMLGQSRMLKVKLGLRQAAKKRRVFHLWLHPFNLASQPDKLFGGLETTFVGVSRYRDMGLLDNMTMGELTDNLKRQAGQKTS